MNHLPVVAITMGDASGIGPEIIVKALARPEIGSWANALVVGDAEQPVEQASSSRIKAAGILPNGQHRIVHRFIHQLRVLQ